MIQEGDLVRLNSGGPVMLVVKVLAGDDAQVIYQNHADPLTIFHAYFPIACITKV